MAVENLSVVGAPELEVLPHAGTAHQLKALGPGGLGLGHHLLIQEAVLNVGKEGVLVAGDQNIDIVRVDDVHPHRGGANLRVAQDHVV